MSIAQLILIRDLANALAAQKLEMLVEVGARTAEIGQPIDNEDSALGRACQYLGQPIPLVPSWDDELEVLS